MKVVVIGYGVQGKKRKRIAGDDCIGVVDPVSPDANWKNLDEVPFNSFDAALVCVPDGAKLEILQKLLSAGKHVLVEKPLLGTTEELQGLEDLSEKTEAICYTAYNHRFEPHMVRVKNEIDSGWLGKIYSVRFFYGNGTARDVRDSLWRDQGWGVLGDLGSHLLDWTQFLFPQKQWVSKFIAGYCHENKAWDHTIFHLEGDVAIQYEMMMLSWRNTFRFDLFAEKGSLHIDCLCKWGPSIFTKRERVLPSGRPKETQEVLECADPTWEAEYKHFQAICQKPPEDLSTDRWIYSTLEKLAKGN
ncbi:MAG: Gfo/Idh/MocA family oxidoreductase [Verrucomicrobiota bacterium]